MSIRRELDAAGINDPPLRADYAHCRRLAAGHGRTYFLATRLLPAAKRPAVHALYGFARTADEIVDASMHMPSAERAERLENLAGELRRGSSATEPSCRAVADVAARYDLDRQLFEDFLASMRMDLTVTEYATYADLERYMHGSAAVIGLQMLPVLGTVGDRKEAEPFAAGLGIAFQLTNFIRDVGEDLRRGRIYLPQESLLRHEVDRDRLERGLRLGTVDAGVQALLHEEIARAREIYRQAEPGIALLQPSSRPCVRTAFELYRSILDHVERADYAVLARRVSVPLRKRIPVAATGLVRALNARRSDAVPATPTPKG